MKIQVSNRYLAENFTSSIPWAVISIADSESEYAKLSDDNRIGLLQVAFCDIDNLISGYKRMNQEDAVKILTFMDEVWDKADLLLIHCEAGVSRSAAVGAAISRIKLGHDGGYFNTHHPNRWVYSRLLKENEIRKRVWSSTPMI